MTQAIDIRKPEAELTRSGLQVRDIAEAWARQRDGERFVEALLSFLNNRVRADNTRRSYAFAITEFFSWFGLTHKRLPTPDKVRRADAYAYASYLSERTIGLEEQRLAQDPERLLDLTAYRFILAHPGARIDAIRKALLRERALTTSVSFVLDGRTRSLTVLAIEADDLRGDAAAQYGAAHGSAPPDALDLRLACLVEHKLFRRAPTVEQIRSGEVDIGLDDPSRAQLDYRVDPEVFSYYVDTHMPDGSARVTTVALRLTALSSFWNFLVDTGENDPDERALLQHNIWKGPLREIGRRVPARKQVARELTTPSLDLVARVLATTFVRSHGPDQALEAAMTVIDGGDVSKAAIADPSLYDLRDRALILFALLVGARATEISKIRKADLQPGRPAIVEIQGKGGRARLVGVPGVVVDALGAFYERLEQVAAQAPPDARVHELLLRSSPLFPAIILWGRNEGNVAARTDRGLSRSGLNMMLRRRAIRAGIEGADLERIHPHGFRHRAALLAVARGRPLPAIQATLGHATLGTTGQYVEEREPARRVLMTEPEGVRAPRPAPVVEPTVIEPGPIEEEIDLDDTGYDIAEDEDLPASLPGAAEEELEPEELEPELVPEEEEPEVALDERGLVGIGAPPEIPVMEPTLRAIAMSEESQAVATLLGVYERNWGQPGDRRKLDPKGTGLLAHTYLGKRTGLVWWQGPKGELKDPDYGYTPNAESFPAMPVVSPGQFIGAAGDAACDGPLCLGLSALWQRWYEDDERGPTAAAALVMWIRAAGAVTLEADDALRRRGGYWLSFDAPLVETTRADYPAREHLDSAIVAWFERTAWQYRPREASRDPIGAALDVPAWYAEADPLASLPAAERAELFDWLQVLTGLPPKDRSGRFGATGAYSRKDVGAFISAICQYEMLQGDDDLGFGFGLDARMRKQSLDVLNQQIKRTVAAATNGRVVDFDYQARRADRKVDRTRQQMAREAAGRSETEEEQAEELRAMYSKYLGPYIMQLVGELFGADAEADPILSLFSLCTAGAPLARAGEQYKKMFRVQGSTIVHDRDFARDFARETGGHSECVARRLARHIYEDARAPAWAERRNWPEVIEYLDTMRAYHVPCPRSLEGELRALVGARGPLPVFEAWDQAQRRITAAAEPDEEEPAYVEVMREEEARVPARPMRPKKAFEENPHCLTRASEAQRLMPNGALLALWAIAMRRSAHA